MRGVVYIAYGDPARRATVDSVNALRCCNELPITVICDRPISALDGVEWAIWNEPGPGARWAKLNLDRLVGYEHIAYLDADTVVRQSIMAGFDILTDGWDMAIAASQNQGTLVMGHIKQDERQATIDEIEVPWPLQLQAGVMFLSRSACAPLFELWRAEWQRWKDQDQAALLRALYKTPLRIWLLGKDWNGVGGTVIDHKFGKARA